MTDTEELIVAAMHLQAERGPDPAAVREALAKAKPSRHYLRTTAVALAAAVVVAAAITVPLSLHHDQGAAPPAVAAPMVPPGQPAFWQEAMAYEPAWLPDGLVETQRHAAAKSVSRMWMMAPNSKWPGPTVSLTVDQSDEPLRHTDDSTEIDLHGTPAYVTSTDEPAGRYTDVTWQVKPHVQVQLMVQDGTHHEEVAEHIARSLRWDGAKQFRAAIDLGWCPYPEADSETSGFTLGGHGPEGTVSCIKFDEPIAEVDLFVDNAPGLTKGTKVAVRGRQGLFTSSTKGIGQQELTVPVGDGRYLNVDATGGSRPGGTPLTQADLVKIANTAVVHDTAYVNWVGEP